MAKAARTFDALRIKLEAVSGDTTSNAVAEVPAVVETTEAVAVTEDIASNAEAEVPAVAETTEAVAVTEETTETSAE